MQILTESQYQTEAKSLFNKVFNSDDAFERPFSLHIKKKVILYPCETYLDKSLLNGLISAASDLKDTGCYLKRSWQDEENPNYFYIPLSELIKAYEGTLVNNSLNKVKLDIDLWIDYSIFSTSGNWGLLVFHERHGLLGGSSNFINKVKEFVPDLDDQVYFFIQKIQSINQHIPNATLEWISELFTHIYGEEVAFTLLKETNLL